MTENEITNQDESEDDLDEDEELSNEYEEVDEFDEEEIDDDVEREPTENELEALFNKNTESFRCLQQVLISRSSLLRNPLYFFPPLQDPGIDEAFNYVEQEEVTDDVCTEKYKKLCKEMNIVPLSRVIKSLPTKSLNLGYYGLTTKQTRAIMKSLLLNCHVEVLNLEENFLNPDAVYYIAEAIRENNTLKVVNMKECRIGVEGANVLNEGIMTTQSLVELNLSFNSLGTKGIQALTTGFIDNGSIKILNLSHNELDESTVPFLANILRENFTLENLDLSWNGFSTAPGMKALCKDGLAQNNSLKVLNLAWNGIATKLTIKPLVKFLKDTERLEYLDLSNNRIEGVLFRMIKNAILKNHSLLGLNLGFNRLTPDEALTIIKLFTLPADQRPKLKLLNLDNVFVKKECVPFWRRATRLGNTITIAGILGNWRIRGPDTNKLLFERARLLCLKPKKKKAKKDFGHFVLSLPDKPMSKPDFETSAKKFKMKKVDRDLLVEIMKSFRYKKSGVDCVKMKETYKTYYPDAQLPPKKKKKGRKGKKKKKQGAESETTEPTTEVTSEPATIEDTSATQTITIDTDGSTEASQLPEQPSEASEIVDDEQKEFDEKQKEREAREDVEPEAQENVEPETTQQEGEVVETAEEIPVESTEESPEQNMGNVEESTGDTQEFIEEIHDDVQESGNISNQNPAEITEELENWTE